MEVWGNNRSVMPFDALGRTRATMLISESSENKKGVIFFYIVPI